MNIDKLIELSEKRVELTKELKQSLIYESCLYHVIRDECNRNHLFFLYDITTTQQIRYDTAPKLRTWLERRKVPNEKVYDYHLIA